MNLIWFVLKILSSQAVRFGDIKASFLLTYIDSNWHRRKYIRDIILTFNIRRRKPATDREHRSESLRFKILSRVPGASEFRRRFLSTRITKNPPEILESLHLKLVFINLN